MPYTKSALEDCVYKRYNRMNINIANDIQIERLAQIYTFFTFITNQWGSDTIFWTDIEQ
ncbi:hypothetical protein [Oceanobacillus sp. FSL H7-0719]|uniref:hypothetical protein n=1 Tax=Oceanobacillus sp. FSL H7-0719 TaxID=2954507 RepID=UPI00325229A9